MSHILLPPAGLHPAAYAPIAPAVPKIATDAQVTAPSQGDAAANDFNPSRDSAAWPNRNSGKDKDEHAAPPTILQIKINSILQEQAEARMQEVAREADKAQSDADAKRAEARDAAADAKRQEARASADASKAAAEAAAPEPARPEPRPVPQAASADRS